MELCKDKYSKVYAIPVKDLRKGGQYLSVEFGRDIKAVYELRCFVREVCSNNALRLKDLIKVIRASSDSFSPKLVKYLNSLSDIKLSKNVANFIYTINTCGYGTYFEHQKNWKTATVNIKQLQGVYNIFKKIFHSVFKERFFYYDADYVNLFTTPDSDLPLYLSHKWDSIIDEELFEWRLKRLNEEGTSYKSPNLKVLEIKYNET